MEIPPYPLDPLALTSHGEFTKLAQSVSNVNWPGIRILKQGESGSWQARDYQAGDFHLLPMANLNRYRLKVKGTIEGFRPVAEHLTAGLSMLLVPNLMGYSGDGLVQSSWRIVKGIQPSELKGQE